MMAESIEFERNAEERRVGYVEDIVGDELTVAGAVGHLTSETAYSDQRTVPVREFAAAGLYVGDAVVLHGYASDTGFVVTRLDRHDALTLHDGHYDVDVCGVEASND